MADLIPPRGLATSWLVKVLTAALAPDIGVGDGIAPAAPFGWPSGQPGVGAFKPYTVVKTLQASPQRAPQPLGLSSAVSWVLPFQLTGWGEVREQADFVCDSANAVIAGVEVSSLNGDEPMLSGFTVQQIVISPLGSTDRDDKTSPQTWSRTDVCTLWVARAQRSRRG